MIYLVRKADLRQLQVWQTLWTNMFNTAQEFSKWSQAKRTNPHNIIDTSIELVENILASSEDTSNKNPFSSLRLVGYFQPSHFPLLFHLIPERMHSIFQNISDTHIKRHFGTYLKLVTEDLTAVFKISACPTHNALCLNYSTNFNMPKDILMGNDKVKSF